MRFNSLIPELSVSDINKSKDFYLNLGFHVVYERKEDQFVFLALEENQIMLEQINDHWNTGSLEYPFGRGINLSMTVKDVKAYYKQLKDLEVKFFLPLEVHSYRVDDVLYEDMEFLVQDPDGYLLRFNN